MFADRAGRAAGQGAPDFNRVHIGDRDLAHQAGGVEQGRGSGRGAGLGKAGRGRRLAEQWAIGNGLCALVDPPVPCRVPLRPGLSILAYSSPVTTANPYQKDQPADSLRH